MITYKMGSNLPATFQTRDYTQNLQRITEIKNQKNKAANQQIN